jgi:hypothetical protein
MQTIVRHQGEYTALRATIRERITAWAAVAVATSAVITLAISTIVPLPRTRCRGSKPRSPCTTNVERIGRYLQVSHERDTAGG